MRYKMLAAAALLGLGLSPSALAQTVTIGTGAATSTRTTDLNGNGFFFFGQSFTAPGGTLQSVTLRLEGLNAPGGSFGFGIYNYTNATDTIGTSLFTTAVTPSTAGAVTISGINVTTNPSAIYAFVISGNGASPGTTEFLFGSRTPSAYGGGAAFEQYTNGDPAGQAVIRQGAYDVLFQAVFAVPEPASWALMIGGFGVVGGCLRLRRKRAAATA